MGKAIFITGTGTDVGKTFVSGLILKKLREGGKNAAYFKAAMSGNLRGNDGKLIPGDAVWVKQASGTAQPIEEMCPYIYEHAFSPHLASRLEGNPVRLDVVKQAFDKLKLSYDYVTVEGSGGILCPLCFEKNLWLENIIKELNLSCLVVADAGLGTINHVGLTIAYLRARQISVKGLIFNHFHPGNMLEEDNLRMCELLTGVNVLACVKDGDEDLDMDAEELAALYAT
ncbi:MAG: dethiobiotin synthase [Lachnospiraceae bacterium]|nr:dethiobiotin synthase [Lachnospiraceae bacterium]